MADDQILSVTDILKVDDTLGVVFGYAIVCREKDDQGNWQDHFDTQGHHIPESEMLKASVEFAQQVRVSKAASKDMHEGDDIQDVIQMLPVTEELAKALGWEIQKTGLVIALKPTEDVLKLYKSGKRTGFSIGGTGVLDEVKA